MKQPSLSHLRIDRAATKKIRAALSKKKQVTITVHLDSDIPPPFSSPLADGTSLQQDLDMWKGSA
jgi:hypothetical protein